MANFILSSFADEAARDLKDQMRISADNGVKHIEMRTVDGKGIAELSREEVKSVKEMLDAQGFALSAIGSPFGKISVTDDFAPHLDQFRRCVETAVTLNAKFIRMFSFYTPEGQDPSVYRDVVMERLEKFVEACGDSGVACCHENEKGIFGNVPDRCLDILRTFDGRIKGIFDPANFIQESVETLPAYRMLEPYIEYLHVKDAQLAGGNVTPSGHGDGHLPEIIGEFAKKSGDRFLTVEPHLALFEAFKNLESDSEAKKFAYASREEAFGVAVGALKYILRQLGFSENGQEETGAPLWTK